MSALNLDIPKKYRPLLRLGTCSWKYEGWKGLIYRPGVRHSGEDYLVEYARHFNSVEVDQWFWSLFPAGVKLPDPHVAKAYAESVPDDFLFTVKAPNAITLTHHYARQAKGHADFANKPNPDFLRDMFNIVVGITWQVSLVALPIYVVIQKFRNAAVTAVIIAVTSIVLKFTWYDHLKVRETFGKPTGRKGPAEPVAAA